MYRLAVLRKDEIEKLIFLLYLMNIKNIHLLSKLSQLEWFRDLGLPTARFYSVRYEDFVRNFLGGFFPKIQKPELLET